MPPEFQISDLHKVLQEKGARWKADVTPLTHLSDEQKLLRLGATPPGGMAAMSARELRPPEHLAALTRIAVGYPTSWDWRNVASRNYVTPIKDQSSCGSCVAFGTVAATESMVRINAHNANYQIDLSEAQLFYCDARSQGRMCSGPNGGWWPDQALNFLHNPGIADEPCYPYTPGDQNCTNLCANWRLRVTTITGWHSITSPSDMKTWLATHGPLATCFTVYDDFYSYSSGVYDHKSGNVAGGHCVCVVGYDDVSQCWICKNSWGTGWGESGFFQIGYGQCGIDAEMYAVEGVATTRTTLVDTAIGGPALANINDTLLALAWTGTDGSHHLNVEASSDGYNFAGKVILGETSIDGPGLVFGNGKVFLAWTGTDSAHHLNVISSPDCHNFSNKVTLGETSHYGPALAFGNGTLYLAWTGTDSRLNVFSSRDGVNWSNKVTLGETSDSSPGLCFLNGKLYLMWQGTDSNSSLNILESTDGRNFTNKVTMGDSSDFRFAMTEHGAELILGWTGRDSSHHLNTMTSPGPISGFGSKLIYEDTSSAGLFLVSFKGSPFVAWTGSDSDHHLNVMKLPFE